MNKSKQFLTIARICHRNFSQTEEQVAPRFCRLKAIQKKFQVDDGSPVFLKLGFGDKFLFNGTVLFTIIGVGLSLQTFVQLVLK